MGRIVEQLPKICLIVSNFDSGNETGDYCRWRQPLHQEIGSIHCSSPFVIGAPKWLAKTTRPLFSTKLRKASATSLETKQGFPSICASDGSPYEKRVDAKGRVLSDESIAGEVPFELPEGWCWARLDSLAAAIVDGDHQAPPQQSAGIPFLVISNISNGMLDFHSTRFVGEDYFKQLDYFRKPQMGGSVGSVEKVGVTAHSPGA